MRQAGLATEAIRWAVCAGVVLGAVSLSILFFDRPLAEFAASHRIHIRGINYLAGLPGLMLGPALVVPVVDRLVRMPASGWWRVAMACSKAAIWTAAAVELALKPVFGRPGPFSWLNDLDYGFHWFRGSAAELRSMPSGEAAILAAIVGVLWFALPRLRPAYLVLGGLEAVSLVWFNWHFASDVVAGAAIGAAGAALAGKQAV